MRVRDIMRRNVATVRQDDSLATALQVMLWAGSRHLPVLEGRRLVGVLTERDLLRLRAEKPEIGLKATVSEAMTQPARYADPEEPVAAAAGRMADARVGCLPVVEGGQAIGIVTSTDVLRALEIQEFAGPAEPGESQARDLMTSPVMTIESDDLLVDAASRMAQYQVRHLPVTDGEGRLIGIVSDRDLRLPPAVLNAPDFDGARKYLESTRVHQVMTSDVIAVGPETGFDELVSIFAARRLSAVPVIDDARHVLGMVSYVDVLRRHTGPSEIQPRGEN